MSNIANNLNLIGNISQIPKRLTNANGSQTVLITLAVEDDFRSTNEKGEKVYQANFIPVRVYVRPEVVNSGKNMWDRVTKGSPIAVGAHVSARAYTDKKTDETVYPKPSLEADGFPKFLESKAEGDARLAKNAAEEAAKNGPAADAPAAGSEETAEQKADRLQRELNEARAAAAAQEDGYNADAPFQ